ncbi:hypothetical protein D3C86_2042700 [compost metagenome]
MATRSFRRKFVAAIVAMRTIRTTTRVLKGMGVFSIQESLIASSVMSIRRMTAGWSTGAQVARMKGVPSGPRGARGDALIHQEGLENPRVLHERLRG